ncbi:MAG: TIGR04076 family protein, partial [Clostridiales bacterium]|nr:TIGR04076 family protein [Clostridiales bacterium]
YGDWIKEKGVAICCCNDGLRPVIFKLEATTEEAKS